MTRDGTVVKASDGRVSGDRLNIRPGFLPRTVRVTYLCRSADRHAAEISAIRSRLLTVPDALARAIEAVEASPYNDPLLFISHRWETSDHPDPDGHQLRKLKSLKNCFIIYDYTSFPQMASGRSAIGGLRSVLNNMHHLMNNVIVMASPDYIERGWCLYEYLAACLTGSIVCDEMQDPRFVALRNWVATREPPAANAFHDGHEALSVNFIAQAVIKAVNELTPLMPNAKFTAEQDRLIVKDMLVALLKQQLPPKRDLDPYMGESGSERWSDEELEGAFQARLPVPALDSTDVEPFQVAVPSTLEDAVDEKYHIDIKASNTYLRHEMTGNPYYQIIKMFGRKSTGKIAPS